MYRDQRAKEKDGQCSVSKHTETPCSIDATSQVLSKFGFRFRTFIENCSSLGRQLKKHRISAETDWDLDYCEWTYAIQRWSSIEPEKLHPLNKESRHVLTQKTGHLSTDLFTWIRWINRNHKIWIYIYTHS